MTAPYPTYRGRVPKQLVSETNDIVRGKLPELASPTVFGNQMICIANYFLAKEVKETGTNTGKFIDEWAKEYSKNDQSFPKQAAWCEIFMWKIAEEAAKLQKCNNPMPAYDGKFRNDMNKEGLVWGNARNTVAYLQQKGVRFSKSVPIVGCMMFRNSKESSASGHWGIVTGITDTKFRTIEGNIQLQDGSEGVGYWEYDNSEIMDEGNGIVFAHVQENAGCGAEVLPYNGYACQVKEENTPKVVSVGMPRCITKRFDGAYIFKGENGTDSIAALDPKTGKWLAYDLRNSKWVEIIDCKADFKTPEIAQKSEEPAPTKTDYSPAKDTSGTKEQKIAKCRTKIVSVPAKSELQHYSVLRDLKVLCDITGAKNLVPDAERNGSALWYNNRADIDPKEHTGFGIFKDHVGNTIFVLDLNQPKSVAISGNYMLGYQINAEDPNFSNAEQKRLKYNYIYIPLGTIGGDGWIEKYTQVLHSRQFATSQKVGKDTGIYDDWLTVRMNQSSNLNHIANIYDLPYEKMDLFGYLERIENIGKPLPDPIVVVIDTRDKPPSIAKILDTILSVATTVTNILGIPVPPVILNTTNSLVAIATAGVDSTNALDFLGKLSQLAEYYAPETVKGIKTYANGIVDGLGENIKTATQGLSDFYKDMNVATALNLKTAEKTFGLYSGEIQKLYSRYTQKGGLGIDLTKLVGDKDLSLVNKIMENAQNILMLDSMKLQLNSSRLLQDVESTNNPLSDVPLIQDLFATAGANPTMATFPKIQNLVAKLMSNRSINSIISSGNTADMKAALIGQAFGYLPVDKGILRPLQLQALIAKASPYSISGEPFVMPESIGEEFKECFQFVIQQETGAKVINCPTGWNWDKDLKKCVNPNAQSGYTPSKTANAGNTGIVAGGNGSLFVKTDPKDTGTVDKKVISNGGGFDLGFSKVDLNFDLLKNTGNPNVKIGSPLPVDYVPPCLVLENGNYYYYPYGKPSTPKVDKGAVISIKPSEKVLTYIPPNNGIVTGGIVANPNLTQSNIIPNGAVSIPIQSGIGYNPSSLVSSSQPNLINSGQTLPLKALSDMPEKILVYKKSNNQWAGNINGKEYPFDPINCKFIGVIEDNEKEVKKDVTKKDLENELAKRDQARKEAEAEAERLRIAREKDAQIKQEEAEANKRLEELRKRNAELVANNQKLEATKTTANTGSQTDSQIVDLINQVNEARKRENIATAQLNAERLKPADDTAYLKQIESLKQSIENESAKNKQLQQQLEAKNQAPPVKQTAQPVYAGSGTCNECDKLAMPRIVKTETIYGFPESDIHTCPQCGGTEDDCECDY